MTNIFQPDNSDKSKSPEPSPTGRRKLAELLREAMQNGPEERIDVSKNEKQQLQSIAADGKPVSESTSSSTCSTEPTPTVVAKSRKEKAWYTGRCCLPSFVHSLTLDERGQKMSSRPCAVWQWRSSALLPWAVYLARYITRSYCKEVGECLRVLYPCRNQVDTSYSFNWCAPQIDQLQE